MKHRNIVLSFLLGCIFTAVIGWLAMHAGAQGNDGEDSIRVCVGADGTLKIVELLGGCPAGQRSMLLKRADRGNEAKPDKKPDDRPQADKAKLDELDKRLQKLEGEDCAKLGKSRVTAPFEVVDRNGKRIFYVNDGIAEMYNGSGKDVAWIAASNSGGDFVTKSSTANLLATFGASGQSSGMTVTENDVKRLDLGRDPAQGNFRLRFFTSAGKDSAGIGQSAAGTGLAFVADIGGNIKARMGLRTKESKGIFWISNGSDQSVAEITEGDSNGGRLALFSSTGENMVIAGVAEGGFGVVRAGPESFKPGYGLLGLPGSYISGKPK